MKKNEPVAPKPESGWGEFLHWVYCPDAPGKCKCQGPTCGHVRPGI